MPNQFGLDDQTARLNSGGDALAAVETARADEAETAEAKFRKQAMEQLRKLGVATLFENIPDDSPLVVAALQKIAAAGAEKPIKETVVVANQGGSWEFDVYHIPGYLRPGLRYSANEALLALSPNTVIAALSDAGMLRPL